MAAGVFLSYRREESAPQAGRLYDNLSARFGESRVFMDVDSIGLGLDFAEVIEDAIASCEVLLALIGPNWLRAGCDEGARRIDDPADYVRLEIQAALERKVRVVPILLNGAALPGADELPPALRALTRRQALELDDATFRAHVGRLIEQLERVIGVAEVNGSAPPWSAELVDKGEKHRTLNLTLESESHQLHIGTLFGGISIGIDVDGTRVSKELIGEVHNFVLAGGAQHHPARIEVDTTFWSSKLVLKLVEVDGRVLYRE